ncbi:MAG: hypothetical protein F6K31_27990 [Symploca sp. SIO2G7]|nr:hypothetical protein [Symploca sp. SIO2G7]
MRSRGYTAIGILILTVMLTADTFFLSFFATWNSSQFPIPNSQFPIPNSPFPIPNSPFPIPN